MRLTIAFLMPAAHFQSTSHYYIYIEAAPRGNKFTFIVITNQIKILTNELNFIVID